MFTLKIPAELDFSVRLHNGTERFFYGTITELVEWIKQFYFAHLFQDGTRIGYVCAGEFNPIDVYFSEN